MAAIFWAFETGATAAQGKIPTITPAIEHLNASWSIEFWGPSVHFVDAIEPDRTVFLMEYSCPKRNTSIL
ncbi:hypothetical protein BHYA_0112g00250 [Botrytis hyacinthi]|uniref:Uncharacterized protein n=1 Tax=Botrytis hyacinthi TaxID=278943 RepID=A0A4Z1GJ21_9HELO|nr:hypothetical protein BHYA_0112g00250 [Botrytis hyacinthi]